MTLSQIAIEPAGSRLFERPAKITNAWPILAVALCYLIPNLLFAADLRSPERVVVLAGGAAIVAALFVGLPCRDEGWLQEPLKAIPFLYCQLAALGLLILGGEAHLFYANSDWLIRDAVLVDLVKSHGLPAYSAPPVHYFLRAPLGMYLAPAAFGKIAGLRAADIAVLLQNTPILGVILYGFSGMTPRKNYLTVLWMVLFSGLCIIGIFLIKLEGRLPISMSSIPSHIDGWSLYWQYSSQVTQLFWVPNHTLPGWWVALIACLAARKEIPLGWFGATVATLALWSPFAVIGALPFLAFLFGRDLLAKQINWYFLACLVASTLMLPIAIYLLSGDASIKSGSELGQSMFAPFYLQFVALQLLPALFVIPTFRRNDSALNVIFCVSLVCLLLLPILQFGANNDLVMRASIPSLTILAYRFGNVVGGGPQDHPVRWLMALAVALVGATSPLSEVSRALVLHRYRMSGCGLRAAQIELSGQASLPNYMARTAQMPAWLIASQAGPLDSAPPQNCWPEYPFDPKWYVGNYNWAQLMAAKTVGARRWAGVARHELH